MLKFITTLLEKPIGYIHYKLFSRRNYFPCKLIGEKPNEKEDYNTVIKYRYIPKSQVYTESIQKLVENTDLLQKFSPIDAFKLGAIAMGDALFSGDQEEIKKRFEKVKKTMLNSARG